MWKLGRLFAIGLALGLLCASANAELLTADGDVTDEKPTLIYFADTGEVMVDPGVIPGLGYRRLLMVMADRGPATWNLRSSSGAGNKVIPFYEDGANPVYRFPGSANPGYYSISGPNLKQDSGVLFLDDYDPTTGNGNFYAGLNLVDPGITYNGDMADLILAMSGGDINVARANGLWPGEFRGQRPVLTFGPLFKANLAEAALLNMGIQVQVNPDGLFPAEDITDLIYVDDNWTPPGDPDGGDGPGAAAFIEYLDGIGIGLAPPENIPEPSTFVLLAMGALGLLWAYRRRNS